VRVLSQDDLVAPRLADYLRRHPEMDARLARTGRCRYLTTDANEHFDHLAEIFMGHPIKSETVELKVDGLAKSRHPGENRGPGEL
jgi:glutamate racemase